MMVRKWKDGIKKIKLKIVKNNKKIKPVGEIWVHFLPFWGLEIAIALELGPGTFYIGTF